MKLPKYKDLLKAGSEQLQKMMAGPRAREMKQKALHEISKIDVKLSELKSNVREAASGYPVDFDKIILAQDELALQERRKRKLQEIFAEMFPDGDAADDDESDD